MEYKKFELIIGGDDPIIRATLIKKGDWFRKDKLIVRHVCKSSRHKSHGWWLFMDDNTLSHNDEAIETFYRSGKQFFTINE